MEVVTTMNEAASPAGRPVGVDALPEGTWLTPPTHNPTHNPNPYTQHSTPPPHTSSHVL